MANKIAGAANWQATAEALSGRKCSVRFEQPARAGVSGLFWRLRDTAVIQISPELDEDTALAVFLHEVGHAKMDWNSYKVWNYERPAQPAYTRKYLHSEDVVNLEERAQRQADIWLKACESCSTLFSKHLALMLWSYFDS